MVKLNLNMLICCSKNLLMLSVLKLHVLKQLNVFSVTSNQMNVPFFNTNN